MIKSGNVCEIGSEILRFWEFNEINQEWGEGYEYFKGTKFLVLKLLENTEGEIVKILIDGNIRYFYFDDMRGIKCLNE